MCLSLLCNLGNSDDNFLFIWLSVVNSISAINWVSEMRLKVFFQYLNGRGKERTVVLESLNHELEMCYQRLYISSKLETKRQKRWSFY